MEVATLMEGEAIIRMAETMMARGILEVGLTKGEETNTMMEVVLEGKTIISIDMP